MAKSDSFRGRNRLYHFYTVFCPVFYQTQIEDPTKIPYHETRTAQFVSRERKEDIFMKLKQSLALALAGLSLTGALAGCSSLAAGNDVAPVNAATVVSPAVTGET